MINDSNMTNEELNALALEQEALYMRQKVRDAIRLSTGDTASLLGTTADGVQLLLLKFAELVVDLKAATSLAEVNAAAAKFEPDAAAFLANVQAGTTKLTTQGKGEAAVINDIEARSTAVHDVLFS